MDCSTRGVLVRIGGGEDVDEGGAGDSTRLCLLPSWQRVTLCIAKLVTTQRQDWSPRKSSNLRSVASAIQTCFAIKMTLKELDLSDESARDNVGLSRPGGDPLQCRCRGRPSPTDEE